MSTWPSRLFRICLINSQDLPNQHLQGESTTLVVVAKDTVTVVSFHGHKVIACHHTMEDIVFKVFNSKVSLIYCNTDSDRHKHWFYFKFDLPSSELQFLLRKNSLQMETEYCEVYRKILDLKLS